MPRPLVSVPLFAVILVLAGTAGGATPKAWMWTPAQAATAARAIEVHPGIEGRGVLFVKSACRGQGRAVARRFTTFRCTARFETRASLGTEPTVDLRVLWAKVRKVGTGQLCVALDRLAAIPAACLATAGPTRVLGESEDAGMAVREFLPTKFGGPRLAQGKFICLGHGAGYYACTFESNRNGSVNVTLTRSGPRFTALVFTT